MLLNDLMILFSSFVTITRFRPRPSTTGNGVFETRLLKTAVGFVQLVTSDATSAVDDLNTSLVRLPGGVAIEIDTGYHGTLLGDYYGANTGIQFRSTGAFHHAGCVAHARRKVEAALGNDAKHARHLLGMFQLLYEIEDQ